MKGNFCLLARSSHSLPHRLSPALFKAVVFLLATQLVVPTRDSVNSQQTAGGSAGVGGGSFLEPVLGSSLSAGVFGEEGSSRGLRARRVHDRAGQY